MASYDVRVLWGSFFFCSIGGGLHDCLAFHATTHSSFWILICFLEYGDVRENHAQVARHVFAHERCWWQERPSLGEGHRGLAGGRQGGAQGHP